MTTFEVESIEPMSDRPGFRDQAREQITKYRASRSGSWKQIEIHDSGRPRLEVDEILKNSLPDCLGKK